MTWRDTLGGRSSPGFPGFLRELYAWLPAWRQKPDPGEPPDLDQDQHEGDPQEEADHAVRDPLAHVLFPPPQPGNVGPDFKGIGSDVCVTSSLVEKQRPTRQGP